MSTKRRESARAKRDEAGNVLCSCGCGRPPGNGRRSWHSAECVETWLIANQPQHVRRRLRDRDHGVCAMCGVDAVRAHRRAKVASSTWEWARRHGWAARIDSWRFRHGWNSPVPEFLRGTAHGNAGRSRRIQEAREKRLATMRAEGWNVHRQSSWWEADHIVPVVEGGGQCGIENYQTLCIRCHRNVTRELRARLAAKRKATK